MFDMLNKAPKLDQRINDALMLLADLDNCNSAEDAAMAICIQQQSLARPWHKVIQEGFLVLKQENEKLMLEKAMIKRLCE